jgi:uncharacterized phage protein gp47/JayE
MPAPYGLTAAGFSAPTQDELLALLQDDYRSKLGAGASVLASPLSFDIEIQAERLRSLWAATEGAWQTAFADLATGVSLDLHAAGRRMTRTAATGTVVTLTLTGTPTTVVPEGTIFADEETGRRFVLDADATIGGGGTVSATATGEDMGPFPALAGNVTQIVTPVSGLTSVTNPADHTTLGADAETDDELRARYFASFETPDVATADVIEAAIRTVTGVTEARVFSNDRDVEDEFGVPAHGIMAVVVGGDDTAVAAAIFAAMEPGCATAGTTTESVADANGDAHDVRFSRPVDVDIYVTVEVTLGGVGTYPADGDDQVEAGVLTYGDGMRLGGDVIVRDIDEAINVSGIRRTTIKVGTSPSPTSTDDIVIDRAARAVFDSTRVTVTRVS